ncbi:hypothetical protein [Paractinoplanes maris]|uniref:hypothetical protein n=1 Tax=Paractinoplanes maris TaxID=1734446 RepID=UPI00202267D9|nr:hypothetical protein [Actinoplanes maris]
MATGVPGRGGARGAGRRQSAAAFLTRLAEIRGHHRWSFAAEIVIVVSADVWLIGLGMTGASLLPSLTLPPPPAAPYAAPR